ncbi:MAG: zinc ribbon domain-containing protein [Cyanophyceae cyanobacterium]
MKRLWGRKVSDLGFASFLNILQWVADKKGKQVVFIDSWYPSTKTCSSCGAVRDMLPLEVRRWRCKCGSENDRDTNAAKNIERVGTSTLALGNVSQALPAVPA